MKKSVIDNIPSIPRPKKIAGDIKYIVLNRMVNNMLQLTVYVGKFNIPNFDIFIDIENEEWLSKKFIHNGKVISDIAYSEAMFSNLVDYYYFGYYRDKIFVSDEDLIYQLFSADGRNFSSLLYLNQWQQSIMNKRNDLKLAKKFRVWDEELKIFDRKIPDTFKEYMRREADGSYFMFYDNSKSTIGYCSRCKEEVPLMHPPKQNATYKCPNCHKETKFKRKSQITTLCTDCYNGALIEKVHGVTIIRQFDSRQLYRGTSYDNPTIYFHETNRYIFNKDGSLSFYWYGMYNNRICRWNKVTDPNNLWVSISYIYTRNSPNIYVRNSSVLKYSSWKCWKKQPCDLIRYLMLENQSKGIIEKLVRIGLENVAKYFMSMQRTQFFESVNLEGKDLGQIIKLDQARLKRLRQFDSKDYYKWLLMEKERNTIFDDKMIIDFVKNNVGMHNFSHLPKQMSFMQINNYIKKQAAVSEDTYVQTLGTWKDYLQMARKCGWDMDNSMIYKPSELFVMHSKAILFLEGIAIDDEVEEIEKKWPLVNPNLEQLKRFEYIGEKYSVLVPNCVKDIVKEGHCLHHCIHNCDFYFDRISNRESYIFFLRKSNSVETSWYTLEVEQNGNILQKRTTGDTQKKDLNAAIPFLKEFQQFFLSQLTEEDKRLGEIAEEKRIERYKKYRKDNRRVNKGKFAGQLLADLLEADLIVA